MVCIGTNGNTHYIICTETDEAYMFNSFGEGKQAVSSRTARVDIKDRYTEVDVVSILKNSKGCNVLCNGHIKSINVDYIEVFNRVRNTYYKCRQNSIIYRLQHGEEGIPQLLLVFRKGTITITDLSSVLGTSPTEGWIKIY